MIEIKLRIKKKDSDVVTRTKMVNRVTYESLKSKVGVTENGYTLLDIQEA